MTEAALVSNETLGFLSMRYGLQQYLNHRDHSLPKRIESYFLNVQDGSCLWAADPPKPISDIVESILGAVHVDSNFAVSLAAATQILSPVLRVVDNATKENGVGILRRMMKHPKKSLQEMAGELFDINTCVESRFTASSRALYHILHKGHWRHPANDESCHVSCVTLLGTPIVAVADESLAISKNRASALIFHAIDRNPDMKERINRLRSNVERGIASAACDEV